MNKDKASLLEEGLTHLNAKKSAAAIAAFQKVLQIDPDSSAAYSGIGHAFFELDEFEGAKVAFSKSIELNPTAPRFVLLGMALKELGQPLAALRAFRNALRIDPDDGEALFNLGDIIRKRSPKVAIQLFESAAKLLPESVEARLETALVLNRQREFRRAKDLLQEALELDRSNIFVWIELASSLWGLDERDEAKDLLREAIASFPNSPAPVWNLATYAEESGEMAKAETLFRRAVALRPTDQFANAALADFLSRHPTR